MFVTHAYPYAQDRSTFLVETDEATWRKAGFEATTAATPFDASDDVALDYLSDVFAPHLGGHRLIGNRTRWLQFRTVRCARWHDGRTVLLGDAAHTAHYSVGSGTKLAMEDAIALVAALDGVATVDDLDTALTAYAEARRPAVGRIQDIAERSRRWWDTFPERLELPVEQLLVAYMSRAGNVPLDRFAAGSPEVVQRRCSSGRGRSPAATPWRSGCSRGHCARRRRDRSPSRGTTPPGPGGSTPGWFPTTRVRSTRPSSTWGPTPGPPARRRSSRTRCVAAGR